MRPFTFPVNSLASVTPSLSEFLSVTWDEVSLFQLNVSGKPWVRPSKISIPAITHLLLISLQGKDSLN